MFAYLLSGREMFPLCLFVPWSCPPTPCPVIMKLFLNVWSTFQCKSKSFLRGCFILQNPWLHPFPSTPANSSPRYHLLVYHLNGWYITWITAPWKQVVTSTDNSRLLSSLSSFDPSQGSVRVKEKPFQPSSAVLNNILKYKLLVRVEVLHYVKIQWSFSSWQSLRQHWA